jgi:hypothetical protein
MGLIQSSDTIVFRDVTAGDLISELVAIKKVKRFEDNKDRLSILIDIKFVLHMTFWEQKS